MLPRPLLLLAFVLLWLIPWRSLAQCPPSDDLYSQIYSGDIPLITDLIPQIRACPGLEDSLALAHHMLGAFYYNYTDQLDSAVQNTVIALSIREKQDPIDSLQLGKSCYNLGTFLLDLGEFTRSREYLLRSADLFASRAPYRQYRAYQKLGDVCWEQGDFGQALNYLQLAAAGAAREDRERLLANCYLSFGLCLNELMENQAAVDSLQKAVALYESMGDEAANLASAYVNLGYAYNELGQLEKAIDYFQRSLDIALELELDGLVGKNYNNLGETYLRLGDWSRAEAVLLSGIEQTQKRHDTEQLAGLYNNLAEVARSRENYAAAEEHFLTAVRRLLPAWDPTEAVQDNWLQEAPDKKKLLGYLSDLAHCRFERFQRTQDVAFLRQSVADYRLLAQLVAGMRADFTRDSKLFWLDETYTTFERAIEAAWQLYQLDPDPAILEEAFAFMEENKAVLLLESLDKTRLYQQVPDSLLRERALLEEALRVARRDLLDAAPAERDLLAERTSRLQAELARLQYTIRQSLPAQTEVLDSTVITLAELQRQLPRESLLLEYFTGSRAWYVLVAARGSAQLLRLEPSRDGDDIFQLLEEVVAGQQPGAAPDTRLLYERSAAWYEQLLAGPLAAVEGTFDQLIIVPDGALSYLPFEILLTNTDWPDSEHPPWLLRQYAVSYAYSASTLQKQRARAVTGEVSCLSIAPLFAGQPVGARTCDPEELGELYFSEQEVSQIATHFPGETLLGAAATKGDFLDRAGDYQILHFATHACADYESDASNRIFFYDDHLYPHELQGVDLDAAMVVLSACNTGIGEFRRGEGAMSMARAFAYTGVPSITMSLWSVNDLTTAELMDRYYANLAAGDSKPAALRNAKLQFLEDPAFERYRHPVYWASFVHIGQPAAVVGGGWSWWVWAGLVVLLAVGAWVFRKGNRG